MDGQSDGTRKSREHPALEISELTLGPYGVAHRDGKTVLVPNAAPGDLAEVSIERERSDLAFGRIRRLLRPGPARRVPPCPFLPGCGGCDWQQLEYPAQVEAKARLLAAHFHRSLGVELPVQGLVEPAPAEFGYRARLRLKVGTGGQLGFHELASNRLVQIDRCLLAAEGLNLASARSVALALAPRCEELEIVAAGDRQVVVVQMARAPGPADGRRTEALIAGEPQLAGVILRGRGARLAVGEIEVGFELEPGLEIKLAADAFSQVNREHNRKLIEAVMERAGPVSGNRALDLFCGAGNFSLPLLRRGAEVMGVDADPVAIEAATGNARRLALKQAQFIAMRADELAPFLTRAGYRPELAILDPPRVGARELMVPLGRLRPRRIIYVACDAATATRDLRMLSQSGYRLAEVKGFDFFPNTHHVEIMAVTLLT